MKIPEISQEFRERFLNGPRCSPLQLEMSAGTPLFVREEVLETRHDCDILLRSVFVEYNVSKEWFSAQCRKYAIEVLGLLPSQANTPGSNLIRALKTGNISNQRYAEALRILNYTVVNQSVTIRDIEGKVKTFTVDDAYKKYGNGEGPQQ